MSQVATSDDEANSSDDTPTYDPEDTVYIATAEHRVYHESDDCYQLKTSDADDPQEWTRADAEAWDYTRCKDCEQARRTNGGRDWDAILSDHDTIEDAVQELKDVGEIDAD